MIAYTFNSQSLLKEAKTELEDFNNAYEMYLELLDILLPNIIKSGIVKDYVSKTEELTVVKGKLNLIETINHNSLIQRKIYVDHSEFTVNILLNQIIKSTLNKLISSNATPKKYRQKFRSYYAFFNEVDLIEVSLDDFNNVLFHRNNDRYKFVIYICKLVMHDLLFSQKVGNEKSLTIEDDTQLHTIFEKFVLHLLRKETNYNVSSPKINWNVDDYESLRLPRMETDIVVKHKNKVVIIDTKFYSKNINIYENQKATHLSNNLYQIYSYVNNWPNKDDVVVGSLLYAKTKDEMQPDDKYQIQGNSFYIGNINLDQSFNNIKEDIINYVDEIIKTH